MRRGWKWVVGLGMLGAAAVVCLYAGRDIWLGWIGRLWIVREEPGPVDVLVVLCGDPHNRPPMAANLFHRGIAPRILLTQAEQSPYERTGLVRPGHLVDLELMTRGGVPSERIALLGTNVTSTYDEARAFRAWAEHHPVTNALVLTHALHARRTRWIFRRELAPLGVQIFVLGTDTPRITATNWWRTEQGLLMMQNEWVKSLYYRLKY